MKKNCLPYFISLALVSLFAMSLRAQNPAHFPLYQEVFDTFLHRAQVTYPPLSFYDYAKLVKTDTGYLACWWHRSYNHRQHTQQSCQVFWTPENGYVSSIVLGDDRRVAPAPIDSRQVHPTPQKDAACDPFNMYRYAGYSASYRDNMASYNQSIPETAGDYYSRARLANQQAARYVRRHKKTLPQESSTAVRTQAVAYIRKSIDYHRQLVQLAPDYPTCQNTATQTYDQERLSWFFWMKIWGLDQEATRLLPRSASIGESSLLAAKERLVNCPSNAILFFDEYKEYYATYYLQQVQQVRTDVLILHTALFRVEAYLQFLQRPKTIAQQNLTYSLARSEHWAFNHTLQHPLPPCRAGQIMDWLNRETGKEVSFPYCVPPVKAPPTDKEDVEEDAEEYDEMPLMDISPTSHSVILLLAIVHANDHERPILFADPEIGLLEGLGLYPLEPTSGQLYQFSEGPSPASKK